MNAQVDLSAKGKSLENTALLSTGKLQTLQNKKSAFATIGHSTVVSSEITSRKCGRIRFKLTNGKFKLFDFTMNNRD